VDLLIVELTEVH